MHVGRDVEVAVEGSPPGLGGPDRARPGHEVVMEEGQGPEGLWALGWIWVRSWDLHSRAHLRQNQLITLGLNQKYDGSVDIYT